MLMKHRNIFAIIGSVVTFLIFTSFLYAKEQAEVQISAEKLVKNIYMLSDSGGIGNTTVLTGDAGVLMIETKVEASVDKFLSYKKETTFQEPSGSLPRGFALSAGLSIFFLTRL